MCRQPVWPGLRPAFPKLRIAHGDKTRACALNPLGEGSDFGAMCRKLGACIGVQRLPEQIKERGRAVAERVRQTEGMLDQLGGIQPWLVRDSPLQPTAQSGNNAFQNNDLSGEGWTTDPSPPPFSVDLTPLAQTQFVRRGGSDFASVLAQSRTIEPALGRRRFLRH